MSATTLNTAQEREPMLRNSLRPGFRLWRREGNYHAVCEGSRWTLCGCCKEIRGTSRRFSSLRKNVRKHRKWGWKFA